MSNGNLYFNLNPNLGKKKFSVRQKNRVVEFWNYNSAMIYAEYLGGQVFCKDKPMSKVLEAKIKLKEPNVKKWGQH